MYTTKPSRLLVLFLPPIFTVLFVQLNNKMYDYDKLNLTQSCYFLVTNILMAVFMNSISGILTWYLSDYRMKELVYELEELKVKLGTFLPTCNKKRVEKAIKNVWQITNIYFIPINFYKSFVSVVGSLIIINGFYLKVGLVVVYLTVMLISNIFTKYMSDPKVKDIVFDPKSKHGYEEEKTKEELNPVNITTLGNVSEVYSRLTLGHSITNDIDAKMDTETKRAIKNAFRNTLIDTAGAIIFIGLLNVSTRSVAQSASSLCWIISMAFDSFNKWKKVYYLQEHSHILRKLKLHSHQCLNSNMLDDMTLNINEIKLRNVNFEYQSDILVDSDCQPYLAIKNLSCKFEKGKLNYVTGENGGGKSSIFKTLLYNISSGSIYLDGVSRDNIGWLTLRKSIYCLSQINEHPALLSDDILSKLKEENKELALQLGVDNLNVSGDGKSGSGGQEQRVHIFTALASGASVILLDEPFSALDVEWKDKVENILLEKSTSKIIIMIGHDCFVGKEHKINTYLITLYKQSESGNTELQISNVCNNV
jgi:ABC-type bacteriocin/lantibiotic exporter with double-glycine peptidase domain